ncbi:MAG: hypothetical protein CMO81_03870 [Waddliaceae bacterium]|nr:hypothetical protein [Waddliaceae bacterium]
MGLIESLINQQNHNNLSALLSYLKSFNQNKKLVSSICSDKKSVFFELTDEQIDYVRECINPEVLKNLGWTGEGAVFENKQ